MLGKLCFGVSLLGVVALSPTLSTAASGYRDVTQSVISRGSITVPGGASVGFNLVSSDPLSFDFVSPSYQGQLPPAAGNYLYTRVGVSGGGVVQSFPAPVVFSFRKDAFNPLATRSSINGTFSGSGSDAPLTFKITLPDLLATPLTLDTVDGPKTYYPTVLFDSTLQSAYSLKMTYTSGAEAGFTKYIGSLSFADPDGGGLTDFVTISGNIGVAKTAGLWQFTDSNSYTIKRGVSPSSFSSVIVGKASEKGPGALPEPRDYLLISLGTLGVGAALRRRRALPVSA